MPSNQSAAAIAEQYLESKRRRAVADVQNINAHGSSAWLSREEAWAAGLHKPVETESQAPLILGRSDAGEVYRYGGNGHCLTFAPTGAGKSVSVVVPNLLTYPGSVVCIDPKGAIPAITAARRLAMGQEVVLLDPFDEVKSAMAASGVPGAWQRIEPSTYNPLSQLDPASANVIEDVRLIVSGLIMEEEGKNRYFSDSARTIAECLILHLLLSAPASQWTLNNLFLLASKSRQYFADRLVTEMQERAKKTNDALPSHVANLGQQIAGYSSEGGASIWSTLHRSLNLLQTPSMLKVCQSSDVSFRSLKEKPATVYLVLPANRLNTHSLWLRLMLSIILGQLSDARQSRYPVLFLIDECAALGRMEILETAVGLMRGYGMRLWLIFQDLPQLQRIYGKSAGTFISNSGVRQFFNVNDIETSEFVSTYIGNETREVSSESVNHTDALGGLNISLTARPLLMPDEVRRLSKDKEILLYEGLKPVEARKLVYHKDHEFKRVDNGQTRNLYSDDPYVVGKPQDHAL